MLDFSDWSRSDTIALSALAVSFASLLITISAPSIRAFINRPKIILITKWTHQPADPNTDGKEDLPWQPLQKEEYYCEFQIKNEGNTPNQINEIELKNPSSDGVTKAFSEMIRISGSMTAATEKFIKTPHHLAPGQSLKFTYTFTPEEFCKIRSKPHYLIIQANKLYWLKVGTKI